MPHTRSGARRACWHLVCVAQASYLRPLLPGQFRRGPKSCKGKQSFGASLFPSLHPFFFFFFFYKQREQHGHTARLWTRNGQIPACQRPGVATRSQIVLCKWDALAAAGPGRSSSCVEGPDRSRLGPAQWPLLPSTTPRSSGG